MRFAEACGIFAAMKCKAQILGTRRYRLFTTIVASIGLFPQASAAAQLSADTAAKFEQYVRGVEKREDADIAARRNFLWSDALRGIQRAQAYEDLRAGKVLLRNENDCGKNDCTKIRGGLIHDWSGIVFVPGISLNEALGSLQEYDHDAEFYPAQVVKSKLLARSGDDFRVFLRLRQTEIITVVFNTEYEIHYTRLNGRQAYSRSHSTRIAEVENAGTAKEHEDPPGRDHGFLWRLDSEWHFYEADGGVYIQCRAISLTRDIPTGLGWLVGSFIKRLPAKSLRETLEETCAALSQNNNRAQGEEK